MEVTFGNFLRKARLLKGYTQNDMAKELRTSRSSISKLENDEQELRAADLFLWIQTTQAQDLFRAFALESQVITDAVIDTISNAPAVVSFISPLLAFIA